MKIDVEMDWKLLDGRCLPYTRSSVEISMNEIDMLDKKILPLLESIRMLIDFSIQHME